ncbi:hypothetical protein Tco_0734448 [Tanacetum coccineum]
MTRPDPAMTRWLTGGPAVVTVVRDVDGCQAGVLTSLTTVDCAVDRWYEVQTDMSADMLVRGTRWQDTSVRVMSADSAVIYTFVHSEALSWSIPSEDPYEEAARQLLEQAPRSPEYVPDPMELEDHVPVYIPEPEHPEDLVPVGV